MYGWTSGFHFRRLNKVIAIRHRFFHSAVILVLSAFAIEANGAGRTVTTGILYATPADAVYMNPAALSDEGNGRTGRLAYDNPADGYSVMYANGSGVSGQGVALNAAGPSILTLGYGRTFGTFRVGANLSLSELSFSDSALGLGFLVGPANGFRFGAMFSSLLESGSNNLTLGVGYASPASYHIEFNMRALLSSYSLSGEPYTQTTKAIKYFSRWGIGGFISSQFGLIPPVPSSLNFGGLLQFSWSQSISLDLYASSGDPKFGFGFLMKF